jgi:hypothetical protein
MATVKGVAFAEARLMKGCLFAKTYSRILSPQRTLQRRVLYANILKKCYVFLILRDS